MSSTIDEMAPVDWPLVKAVLDGADKPARRKAKPRSALLPPIPKSTLQQVRRRMREVGLPVTHAARYLGVTQYTLSALLGGRQRTIASLGYHEWPQRVLDFCERYHEAMQVVRRHMTEAKDELRERGLPEPEVVKLLRSGRVPQTRKAGAGRANA